MRERYGKPQYIAATLLLLFLAQCSWLVSRNLRAGTLEAREWYRLDQGVRLLGGTPPWTALDPANPSEQAGPATPLRVQENGGVDPEHSALWYLIPATLLRFWPGPLSSESLSMWGWLARAPYLFFGVMLGASLWYVARRLYGNVGGFIALTLYCFAPGIIQTTAAWYADPAIGAAWGAFGTVFTGIAVAHTLYAPREVVLWNWRRILLLGISIALCIGAQFSVWIVLLPAVAFLLWVGHVRRGAALVIFAAASLIGAGI